MMMMNVFRAAAAPVHRNDGNEILNGHDGVHGRIARPYPAKTGLRMCVMIEIHVRARAYVCTPVRVPLTRKAVRVHTTAARKKGENARARVVPLRRGCVDLSLSLSHAHSPALSLNHPLSRLHTRSLAHIPAHRSSAEPTDPFRSSARPSPPTLACYLFTFLHPDGMTHEYSRRSAAKHTQ